MKKIFTICALGLVMLISIISCSVTTNEVKLTPKSTTLRGDLKDYFEVIEKEYEFIKESDNNNSFLLTIELKKIAELPFDKNTTIPFGWSDFTIKKNYHMGFGITIFDENGGIFKQIAPAASGFDGVYSSDDIVVLRDAEIDQISIVRWSEPINEDDYEKIHSFEITSAFEGDLDDAKRRKK